MRITKAITTWRPRAALGLTAAAVAFGGCGSEKDASAPRTTSAASTPSAEQSTLAAAAQAREAASAPGLELLVLGDSLGRGVQPDAALNLTHGYSRYLAKKLRRQGDGQQVTLVEAACGAATTQSFVEGGKGCLPAAPIPYANADPGSGQLAWAVDALKARGDRQLLVTLTIGGNDLLACVNEDVAAMQACFASGVAGFTRNLQKITTTLAAAAGSRTVLVGSTLYDPILGALRTGAVPAATVRVVHRAIVDQVNPLIRKTYAAAGWKVADLGAAAGERGSIASADTPAVATICRLTWACDRNDVHYNNVGYAAAARVFAAAAAG